MPACQFPNPAHPGRSCTRLVTHIFTLRPYDHAAQCPQWVVTPTTANPQYCRQHAGSIAAHVNAGIIRMHQTAPPQEG